MPTVWNASPYDLDDGAGLRILSNTTATVPASDYVTAAILAGLLVIADGNHAVTTGLGNPAQTQSAPALALLPPTSADGVRIPAGSDLPVDASKAHRTAILGPARVGVVCGASKVDISTHPIDFAPHDTDVLIPSALATLTVPQTAVRLFGYTGGWVVVRYDPDAVTGAALFTQQATMAAGQAVTGGQTVDTQHVTKGQQVAGGSTVMGGSTVSGGQTVDTSAVTGRQTVLGGAVILGGQTVDTLTSTGLITAKAGVKITGAVTADTLTAANWRAFLNAASQSAFATGTGGSGIVSNGTTLQVVTGTDTTVLAALLAATVEGAGWRLAPSSTGKPALLAAAEAAAIVASGGAVYVSTAADTTVRADLYAAALHAVSLALSGDIDSGNVRCAQINTRGSIYAPGFDVSTDPAGIMHSKDYIGGTFHGTTTTAGASDVRTKTAFRPVNEDDVDEVLRAKVMEYEFHAEQPYEDPGRRRIGIIAQDVSPTLQVTHPETGLLNIDLGQQVNVQLLLIQRLTARVAELTERLDRIENPGGGSTSDGSSSPQDGAVADS